MPGAGPPTTPQRSPERVRAHYEIERQLADRLRAAPKEARRQLYSEVYDELFERVADHACSIAKVARKIEGDTPPKWPTALLEMGERVPDMCQRLLQVVLNEDAVAARALIEEDETIDTLHKQLFVETVEFMRTEPGNEANGLHIARLGRELERVGDLMANIAEDVVYLVTGEIVRHEHHAGDPRETPA